MLMLEEMEEELPTPMRPDTILSERSFLRIPMTPGVHEGDLALTDETSWNYILKVPTLQTDKKVALVIGLVWAGELNDHQIYFECLLEPSFSQMDAILFTPADTYGLWSHANVEHRILEFIQYAKFHWPIRHDEIVITGYSIGGRGSWYYAINYDSIFAASIPMASTHGYSQNSKIPIYGICGGRDELVDCSDMQRKVNNSISHLSTFEVAQNLSHFDACNYERSLTNAARWLENSVFPD